MATLTDSGNINETILMVLVEKGFQVWSDEPDSYWAEKNGWDFNSYSLQGLLGLVSVYEHINPLEYKEYWWKTNNKITMDNLPLVSKEYKPIYYKNK